MATRYTVNKTRKCDVIKTVGGRSVSKKENNGVCKARWTNIGEGNVGGTGKERQDRRGINP